MRSIVKTSPLSGANCYITRDTMLQQWGIEVLRDFLFPHKQVPPPLDNINYVNFPWEHIYRDTWRFCQRNRSPSTVQFCFSGFMICCGQLLLQRVPRVTRNL